MQFEIYRANGGQFHWRLVGDDGITTAVSSIAYDSAQDAQRSAAAVREHAGAAAGADDV
jgi:uncharacterized protein YegP (UPF0339 family)